MNALTATFASPACELSLGRGTVLSALRAFWERLEFKAVLAFFGAIPLFVNFFVDAETLAVFEDDSRESGSTV